MIRSRPGFSTVVTKDEPSARPAPPAKVTRDMQPAIAKHSTARPAPPPSTLKELPVPAEQLQAQAEAIFKRMQEEQRAHGPEILVNPAPSPPPIITSPHQD